MAYIYIASPYTDNSDLVMHKRYLEVSEVTSLYLNKNVWCYSPIVHCHEMAKRFNLPRHIDFWKNYNEAMLEVAHALHILQLPGWQDSKGVKHETQFAIKRGIPVTMIPYPLIDKGPDAA